MKDPGCDECSTAFGGTYLSLQKTLQGNVPVNNSGKFKTGVQHVVPILGVFLGGNQLYQLYLTISLPSSKVFGFQGVTPEIS